MNICPACLPIPFPSVILQKIQRIKSNEMKGESNEQSSYRIAYSCSEK